VNVTNHDGRPFSTGAGTSSTSKFVAGPGGSVLMQGFYWDVPDGGNWWNTVKDKVTDWSNAGIGAVWLPPASKAQNGAYSMGYDPTDYYDFGNFNQNGSVETRFGSEQNWKH
jgi:alpha-amylase